MTWIIVSLDVGFESIFFTGLGFHKVFFSQNESFFTGFFPYNAVFKDFFAGRGFFERICFSNEFPNYFHE